jgi:hypothetical protein
MLLLMLPRRALAWIFGGFRTKQVIPTDKRAAIEKFGPLERGSESR